MSGGDRNFCRGFDGLVQGMHVGELHVAIEILARKVAEKSGLDFEISGQQIIDQAIKEGHDLYHQRVSERQQDHGFREKQAEHRTAAPLGPQYEFLKEHGVKFQRASDPNNPFDDSPPEVTKGYRLFEVYDRDGRFSPMCVDVTKPEDWESVHANNSERWGLCLDCILITEEALAKYPGPRHHYLVDHFGSREVVTK